MHKERAAVHDGLKHLNDRDILHKVREGPNKIKRHLKDLLAKLDKNHITLDDQAEIKYLEIPHKTIQIFVKENEELVKTVLMQRDLDFEYPMKMEKRIIKGDILKMVEEEEERLKGLVSDEKERRLKEQEGYEEHFKQFKGNNPYI